MGHENFAKYERLLFCKGKDGSREEKTKERVAELQSPKNWGSIRKHGSPVGKRSQCLEGRAMARGLIWMLRNMDEQGVYRLMVHTFHLPVLFLWSLPYYYQSNPFHELRDF